MWQHNKAVVGCVASYADDNNNRKQRLSQQADLVLVALDGCRPWPTLVASDLPIAISRLVAGRSTLVAGCQSGAPLSLALVGQSDAALIGRPAANRNNNNNNNERAK